MNASVMTEDRASLIRRETWRDASTDRLGLGMWSGKVLAWRFAVFCGLAVAAAAFVAVAWQATQH